MYPLAERVMERGIPVLFLTGYGLGVLPDKFRTTPILAKPLRSLGTRGRDRPPVAERQAVDRALECPEIVQASAKIGSSCWIGRAEPTGHSPSARATAGMPRSITRSARGYAISPLRLTSRTARSSAFLLAACSACRIPGNDPAMANPNDSQVLPRGYAREETHLRRRERALFFFFFFFFWLSLSSGTRISHSRPTGAVFRFTSPKAMARSNSILPKPDVLGEVTIGPPASVQAHLEYAI